MAFRLAPPHSPTPIAHNFIHPHRITEWLNSMSSNFRHTSEKFNQLFPMVEKNILLMIHFKSRHVTLCNPLPPYLPYQASMPPEQSISPPSLPPRRDRVPPLTLPLTTDKPDILLTPLLVRCSLLAAATDGWLGIG